MKTKTINPLYEKYYEHMGHNIVVVAYGDPQCAEEIAIECETCNCVLTSEAREDE
jgi:hypothetical protein